MRKFKVGTAEYGFIDGPYGFIVVDNDFVHYISDDKTTVLTLDAGLVPCGEKDADGWQSLMHTEEEITLDDIYSRLEPIESMRDFCIYWGIKQRMRRNYHLLKNSIEQIGAVDDLPEWGSNA